MKWAPIGGRKAFGISDFYPFHMETEISTVFLQILAPWVTKYIFDLLRIYKLEISSKGLNCLKSFFPCSPVPAAHRQVVPVCKTERGIEVSSEWPVFIETRSMNPDWALKQPVAHQLLGFVCKHLFCNSIWTYKCLSQLWLFKPVCLLSGIPAMVDLAAMRDAVAKHGEDPSLINPKCPTDLIVDHSLQIDFSKWCVCFIFICIFYKVKKYKLSLLCSSCISFSPTVPYRMLQTPVEGKVRLLLAPYPPGFHPEAAHIAEASKAPAAKRPAAIRRPRQEHVQRRSSRSRTRLFSAPSTWSPSLSKLCTTGIHFLLLDRVVAYGMKYWTVIFRSATWFSLSVFQNFFCRTETAVKNQEMELIRNKERLQFFKVSEQKPVTLKLICTFSHCSCRGSSQRITRLHLTLSSESSSQHPSTSSLLLLQISCNLYPLTTIYLQKT